VTLGPVTEADLPLLHRWINDRPLVLLSAPYRPVHFSDHNAWWRSVSSDTSIVIFAIRTNPDGRLIGTCQLLNINRTHGTAELQIRIGDEQSRGRSFGSESVRLLVRHAFADQRLHRVMLHVLASNAAAIATYERTGFTREGLLREAAYVDGRREDVVVMAILSSEFAGGGHEVGPGYRSS
jgi:RimJ/RimL family protein N-acetyltransferase